MDAYNPKGNGTERSARSVRFIEVEPPCHLRGFVHRFLELKTETPLSDDYIFYALPDACTYIIFDQLDTKNTAVTKLCCAAEELNLGKMFHYVNIRLLPGVWQGGHKQIAYGKVDSPYSGNLPLIEINHELSRRDFVDKQSILSALVEKLIDGKLIADNPITEKIFRNIDKINSVSDMAAASDLSARQLQRTLKRTTGLAPHDFLKVLRLQKALRSDDTASYADQSHFIHSFRRATGYTPVRYARKFDV